LQISSLPEERAPGQRRRYNLIVLYIFARPVEKVGI
jgi:hypothetical protein